MKLSKNKLIIIIILMFTLLIRLYPIDFPVFTSDEARIAFRGYTLSHNGVDELGRKFPFVFNSLDDYQLPLTSYLAVSGIIIFGKNDFGARIVFVLIGTGLVFLIYKLSKLILEKENLSLFAAIIASFSPGLIFFSKFPNEFILAAFLLTVFLLFLKKKVNIIGTTLLVLLMFLTTKIFWFILIPLLLISIFTNKEANRKKKLYLLLICVFINLLAILLFIKVPQGWRSLTENNFSIVNDVTIKNTVERLRSQVITNWPHFLDRILFSKLQFLIAGIFHWISHLQSSILFGNFDNTGKYGFLNLGAFTKIMIIPFVLGILALIKEKEKRFKQIFFYIVLLTFPIFFMYPDFKPEYLIVTLPLIVLIIALGFKNIGLKLSIVIFFIALVEYSTNLLFLSASLKNANDQRPFWIREIVTDGYNMSEQYAVAFSDNLTSDLIPFLEWYTPVTVTSNFADINFPYKFRQTKLGNIRLIGSEAAFYKCGLDRPTYIIASKRDEKEMRRWLNLKLGEIVNKIYKDGLSNEIAFSFEPTICVH